MEGWETWDIALRSFGQLRMAQFVVIGIDVSAALKIAETLGYDLAGVSELLSGCEVGMVAALNDKLKTSAQEN